MNQLGCDCGNLTFHCLAQLVLQLLDLHVALRAEACVRRVRACQAPPEIAGILAQPRQLRFPGAKAILQQPDLAIHREWVEMWAPEGKALCDGAGGKHPRRMIAMLITKRA